MRMKKLENLGNKIGLTGCKWSSLNAPREPPSGQYSCSQHGLHGLQEVLDGLVLQYYMQPYLAATWLLWFPHDANLCHLIPPHAIFLTQMCVIRIWRRQVFLTQICIIRNWKSQVLATTYLATWRYLRYFLVPGMPQALKPPVSSIFGEFPFPIFSLLLSRVIRIYPPIWEWKIGKFEEQNWLNLTCC